MTEDLLPEILEECLQKMAQGEPLEAILERYPLQREALYPLLQAAAQFQRQVPRRDPTPAQISAMQGRIFSQVKMQRRRIPRQVWVAAAALFIVVLVVVLLQAGGGDSSPLATPTRPLRGGVPTHTVTPEISPTPSLTPTAID